MDELRRNIAVNIQRLRLQSGMTQQELGAELNYTDKAVSKWERGESAPDVGVLLKIARLFGVTLDYIVSDHEHDAEPEAKEQAEDAVFVESEQLGLVRSESYGEVKRAEAIAEEPNRAANLAAFFGYKPARFNIALMSAACVWLIAIITYVVLTIFTPGFTKPWICFVFAVPATMIVLLIFNLLWGKMEYSFTLMSALLWTALGSVFIFFIDKQKHWELFLIGVPAQIILILWSKMYRRRGM